LELGLIGRTAVITGASKGIGKAIARGFAAEGANLVLLARGIELLEQTAAQIRAQHDVDVLVVAADVTDAPQVDAAAERAVRQFGTLHVVVNNAGSLPRRQDPQLIWSDAEWMADVDVKTFGMLRVVRAFSPYLAHDGSGRIISIGGVAGNSVWAPALTHGLNNAAINQVSAYMAEALAGAQITVNTVVPGPVATEWRASMVESIAQQQGTTPDEWLVAFCRQKGILAERCATLDEVSDAVLFLASDRARYITGTRLVVDGGFSVNAR
jgi:3-oxoacyl-[acyl-carrier protein] reductase